MCWYTKVHRAFEGTSTSTMPTPANGEAGGYRNCMPAPAICPEYGLDLDLGHIPGIRLRLRPYARNTA